MIPPLTYLDRYRNEGTRIYSQHADYSEALEMYRPNSSNEGFELATFRVPRDGMHVYEGNKDPGLSGGCRVPEAGRKTRARLGRFRPRPRRDETHPTG